MEWLWAFNKFGTTGAVQDISNGFDRVWHVRLRHKFNSRGILHQLFRFT